jgi:phosphatidate cytidylyltransferase
MKRILTAVALVPPVVYVVLGAPYPALFAVVVLVACLCYWEYSAIAGKLSPGFPAPLGYGAGLLVLAWPGETWLLLTALTLLAMTLAMRATDLAAALPRASFLLLGVVYVFGCWKCALLVRAASPHWLMFALLVNWVGDAGAYYVGKNFGKRKLARRVSPGKTWEGAIGSAVTATIFAGWYLIHFLPRVSLVHAIGITIATNIAGQLGDLAESAIKRGAGVKDSGTILPGHGGFLDRVDSTLFALPVVYAYVRFLS